MSEVLDVWVTRTLVSYVAPQFGRRSSTHEMMNDHHGPVHHRDNRTGHESDAVKRFLLDDYRDEGGVKIPQFEMVASPILIKFKDIKINPELAPDIFDLPEDIPALAKAQGLVGGSSR
jgi:hypothetical protein